MISQQKSSTINSKGEKNKSKSGKRFVKSAKTEQASGAGLIRQRSFLAGLFLMAFIHEFTYPIALQR